MGQGATDRPLVLDIQTEWGEAMSLKTILEVMEADVELCPALVAREVVDPVNDRRQQGFPVDR